MRLANNAKTILKTDIVSSSNSFLVKDGEGALFVYEGDTQPFIVFVEEIENGQVVKREAMKVKRNGDTFYILNRAVEEVVSSETDDPKVREAKQFNFTANKTQISLYIGETDINEVNDTTDYKNAIKAGEIKLNSGVDTVSIKKDDGSKGKIETDIEGDTTINGDVILPTGKKFKGDGSLLTGISAEVTSASLNIMLGEDGTKGLAYSKVKYEQLTGGTDNDFGSDNQPEVAQSFYGVGGIDKIIVKVKKTGSDRNDIYAEIQSDDGGKPSGIVLSTSQTVAKEDLSTDYQEVEFDFSGFIAEKNTLYHFVLKATGTDVNDYFEAESAGADKILGTLSTYDGTSWTNQTDDLYIKIIGQYVAMKGGDNFVGILQEDTIAGNIGKFNTTYDNHQSWLIIGNYYGYDNNGNIISGGDYRAISENELILTDKSPYTFLFGNGSDGDLIITSGTTNLNLNQVYQFSSINIASGAKLSTTDKNGIMDLRCATSCIIDGEINIDGIGRTKKGIHMDLLGIQLYGGDGGNGGNGGHKGGISGQGGNTYGIGGGGGGGGADANGGSGGDGGNGDILNGYGGLGCVSSSNTKGGDGGDPGKNGGNGEANGGNGGGCDGGNGVGGGGGGGGAGSNGSYRAAGGGGGGGGLSGGIIRLYTNIISGNGIINANGGSGGDGGNGTINYSYGAGGGGAGGGGGGGIALILAHNNRNSSIRISTNKGGGGNGGSGKAGGEEGHNGGDGTDGEYLIRLV